MPDEMLAYEGQVISFSIVFVNTFGPHASPIASQGGDLSVRVNQFDALRLQSCLRRLPSRRGETDELR